MAQQAQLRHEWKKRDGAFGHGLDTRELATLRIGVEAVDMAAEDHAALIRLREIEKFRPPGHHMATGLFTLQLSSSEHVLYNVVAQNILGSELMNKNISAEKGLTTVPVDLNHFDNGIYILTVQSLKDRYVVKIVKE